MQELFVREKAPEIKKLVLTQMSEEAQEPKEWWRVLVEVREAEKKRKMALQEARIEGSKEEELAVVEATTKNKSRSKRMKKKSKAERTTNEIGGLEESEGYGDPHAGESSTRVTTATDAFPFTFDFKNDSNGNCLIMEATGSEHTTAASPVSAVIDSQPGGKRHRKGSKSMTQLKVNEIPDQDDSRDAAVERLKAEALPVSLEVAREERTTLRRERSVKIQFLRQRTLSRGSSVAGSGPPTPSYRDSPPDMGIAPLEEVIEASKPLAKKSTIPKLYTITSASAHKETFSATTEQQQAVKQQKRKKHKNDLVPTNRPATSRIKSSRIEKQPEAVTKSSNQNHVITHAQGSATTSRVHTQVDNSDQVVTSAKLATLSPDPNFQLPYINAVLKADENYAQEGLHNTDSSITTFDGSQKSEDRTNVTAASPNPALKKSHHASPHIADDSPSPVQKRKSKNKTPKDSPVPMERTLNSAESSVTTDPCYWRRDEDRKSTDTDRLEKATAAWQDQSDDEVGNNTNYQFPLRDPLFYSVNNEAYFFRDRPFVVPPELESEENTQNGTCFPEIPPLLGNPYTGKLLEQAPSTPPLICRCKLHCANQALIDYNPSVHRVIIHPSLHPLPDLRNDPYHPDWLPPFKLAEYQAYEQAGYPVYRFDRVTFECALSRCREVIKDHVRSTLLCNGCGPYTDVRYCSKEHLFEDCQTHWKICGLVPPHVVWDDWTMPSRYRRRYPAIKDIRGRRTPERQRQQAYSIHHRASDYVIFSDWKDKHETGQERHGTGKPIVFLLFKDGDPMKDTFNRLLNIAFFGQSHITPLPLPPPKTPVVLAIHTLTHRRPPPHPNPHPPLPPHPLALPRPPPLDPRSPKRPLPPTLPRILLRPAPSRLGARPMPRRLGRRRGRLVLGGLQARRRT